MTVCVLHMKTCRYCNKFLNKKAKCYDKSGHDTKACKKFKLIS